MPEPPRSADLLVSTILGDNRLLDELKTNPGEILRRIAGEVTRSLPPPAFVTDKWTYRIVVIALGLVCVGALGGAVYLSAVGGATPKIPDVLTALGSAAIGALAGLLAPSPTAK